MNTLDTARTLRQFYGLLRDHFGYAATWWPGTPAEVFVTAILVQQSDWAGAWRATQSLRDHGLLDLPALATSDADMIRGHIRQVAFSPTKARRLVSLATTLTSRGHGSFDDYLASIPDSDRLRADLLRLPGIGPETADCILTFACDGHARVVVDASARRILERTGLFELAPAGCGPQAGYAELQQFLHRHVLDRCDLYGGLGFDPAVPTSVALARDFHAMIVEIGRHHCLKNQPLCHAKGRTGWRDYDFCHGHCGYNGCGRCPLVEICATARLADSARG